MNKKIIITLIFLSMFTNAAFLTKEHPKLFTEGVEEYVEVNLGCNDLLCYDSENCTATVSEPSVRSFTGKIDIIVDNATMLHMNDEFISYPKGVYGWKKGEDLREGDYYFRYNCQPSTINERLLIKVRSSDHSSLFDSPVTNIALGKDRTFFLKAYFLSLQDKYAPLILFFEILFILIDTIIFLILLFFNYFYVWLLGVEAIICVIAFLNAKSNSGLDMIMNFFVYNVKFILDAVTLSITIGEFIVNVTIKIVISAVNAIGSLIPFT